MPIDTAFSDWYGSRTPVGITNPKEIPNAAQLRDYNLLRRALSSPAKIEVQYGNAIRFEAFLDDPGLAENRDPGDTFTIINPQVAKNGAARWCETWAQCSWNDREVSDKMTGVQGESKQFTAFRDMAESKDQQMWTSLFNLMERNFARAATTASMVSGKDPFSLFYSVTTDGLSPSGFSDVYGLDPTVNSRYRNQTSTYTSGQLFDAQNGILGAFDRGRLLVRFRRPPQYEKYFTDTSLNEQAILTNREGHYTCSQIMRALNQITRAGPNDAVYDPVYDNRPIEVCDAFDDLSSFTSGQPQYLFINFKWMKIVWHGDYTLSTTKTFDIYNKPDTHVKYVRNRYNMVDTLRKAHLRVSQAA